MKALAYIAKAASGEFAGQGGSDWFLSLHTGVSGAAVYPLILPGLFKQSVGVEQRQRGHAL